MSRLRPYMYASDGRQLHMLRYDAAESAMPLTRSFAANDNNPFNEVSGFSFFDKGQI